MFTVNTWTRFDCILTGLCAILTVALFALFVWAAGI